VFAPKKGETIRGNFKDKTVHYNFTMPPEIIEGKDDENFLRELRSGASAYHIHPPSLRHAAGLAIAKLMINPTNRKKFLTGC